MKKLLILPFLLMSISTLAQSSIGIESQIYPAGVIPGLRFDLSLTESLNITSRLALNITDRKDWGEHDNEEGSGAGFGIGIERKDFLTNDLYLHFRSDIWFLNIDWMDRPTGPALCGPLPCPDRTGSSNVTVLQPTIGLAYRFLYSEKFFVKPSLSLGYEINVQTDGENVGEGAILLGGFQFGYLF